MVYGDAEELGSSSSIRDDSKASPLATESTWQEEPNYPMEGVRRSYREPSGITRESHVSYGRTYNYHEPKPNREFVTSLTSLLLVQLRFDD